MKDWYVICTRSGNELNVKERLNMFFEKNELKVLVPRRKLQEKRNGIWREVIKTVFNGYVFVNVEMCADTYYKIKDVYGVIDILKNGCYPVAVPYDEMKVVLSLTEKSEIIGYSNVLYIGGYARIVSGPLKGLEGHIVEINKRKGRARVLINIMGEQRIVQLGINQLQDITGYTEKVSV